MEESSANEIIDWSAIRQFIPGGDKEVAALAVIVRDECPKLLALISEGEAAGDKDRIMRGAHTLRSSATYFGAKLVADTASRIESLGRENKLSDVPTALGDLKQYTEQLLSELNSFLRKQGM